MAHYESPDEMPDETELETGDTVDVGNTVFEVSAASEWNTNQLREMIASAKRALTTALDAFDHVAKTDTERVNVVANVLYSMHEWSHLNAGTLAPWFEGAMERDTVREAETILKESK